MQSRLAKVFCMKLTDFLFHLLHVLLNGWLFLRAIDNWRNSHQ